jgi:hypothetical protein
MLQIAILKAYANKHHIILRKIEQLFQEHLKTKQNHAEEHRILSEFSISREIRDYKKLLDGVYKEYVHKVSDFNLEDQTQSVKDQLDINQISIEKYTQNKKDLETFEKMLSAIKDRAEKDGDSYLSLIASEELLYVQEQLYSSKS